jgi:hypothetical protein
MPTNREKLEVMLAAITDLAETLPETFDVSDTLELLEACRSLFEAACYLETNPFGERAKVLRAAAEAADEAWEEANEMVDAIADAVLTPTQEELLLDLAKREEAMEEQDELIEAGADTEETLADDRAVPVFFETAEPPQAYRELEELGLIQMQDEGSEGEPWWQVELTAAGRRRTESDADIRTIRAATEQGIGDMQKRLDKPPRH